MLRLERIVSKAFESLANSEDKIVNSVYASKFAVNNPAFAGLAGGACIAGATAYLYSQVFPLGVRLGADIYTLAIPAAIAGTGLKLYELATQHREVRDAGLPVEKFYELDRKKAGTRRAALLLSAVFLAAVNGYAYHSGLPLETIARMDIVAAPATYLTARFFMNAFKPISNAASFTSAVTEALAFLASKATGNKGFNIKALESIARNFPSSQTKIELAEAYLDAGKLDDGLITVKDAMEQKTDLPQSFLPLAGKKTVAATAKAHKAIRTGKASHDDYLTFSRNCHAIGETTRAEQAIGEMTQKFPSVESDILAAIFFENCGKTGEASVKWSSAASAIFSKPELKVLPVSEPGIHNVRRYGPTPIIANTFVFKEAERYDDVEFAKSGNALLRKLLGTHSYYTTPKIVSEFTHRNGSARHDIVYIYLEGQSPAEMKQAGTLSHSHVSSIIDYLVWIHEKVSPETSRKGRVNLEGKLEQILKNRHLALPADSADRIRANISFILDEQKDSPYVFAKDPHPAQWRFGKDYLAALDWDDMGATSLFMDSAKFYIHPDVSFSEDELDRFHGEAAVANKNIFSNDSEFRARLLDAMLFQALSFASAWSIPEMSHMKAKRATVLEGTSKVFNMIKQNHSNKLSYDALESDFKKISSMLSTN